MTNAAAHPTHNNVHCVRPGVLPRIISLKSENTAAPMFPHMFAHPSTDEVCFPPTSCAKAQVAGTPKSVAMATTESPATATQIAVSDSRGPKTSQMTANTSRYPNTARNREQAIGPRRPHLRPFHAVQRSVHGPPNTIPSQPANKGTEARKLRWITGT